jgi:hypothetical protein
MAEATLQIGPGKRLELALHLRGELVERSAISLSPPVEEECQGGGFHQSILAQYAKGFSRMVLAVLPRFCEGVR